MSDLDVGLLDLHTGVKQAWGLLTGRDSWHQLYLSLYATGAQLLGLSVLVHIIHWFL